MCGIAGFQVSPGSNTNARLLAHALLTQIESRGSHASGFAYSKGDGDMGIYKNPKPGSQLSLHELPRDAETVILHTRYATQGSPKDNRNNHPVVSTDKRIALVHNGVISNDWNLRSDLGITKEDGEVDSLVLPSLIAQEGVDGLSQTAGYAAIAWLNSDAPDVLSIARLKNSPVAFTWLYDGSFVFASTETLLERALLSTPYGYGGILEMHDGKYMTVTGGFIASNEPAPKMTYDSSSWRRHSTATSGGSKATTSKVTTDPVKAKGSEDSCELTVDEYYEDLEKWREKREKDDQETATRALALVEPNDTWDDDAWEKYLTDLELRDAEFEAAGQSTYGEGYYTQDIEGDWNHYPTLEDMEGALAWYARMSRSDMDLFEVEDGINWVNHIIDLGHVDDSGNLISWIDDMAEIDEHESPAVRNLQYIRDGVGELVKLKGA